MYTQRDLYRIAKELKAKTEEARQQWAEWEETQLQEDLDYYWELAGERQELVNQIQQAEQDVHTAEQFLPPKRNRR